jgi:hypothetical protein
MTVTPEYKVEIIEVREGEYIAKVTETVWKNLFSSAINRTKTFYMGLNELGYNSGGYELIVSKYRCFLQPVCDKEMLISSIVIHLEGLKKESLYPRVVDTINI